MSQAKNALLASVKNISCGGNSDRELKHLAQDVLQAGGGEAYWEIVADVAWLGKHTVFRVANMDRNGTVYNPRADTLERILKACDVKLVAEYVKIKGTYAPKPKITTVE